MWTEQSTVTGQLLLPVSHTDGALKLHKTQDAGLQNRHRLCLIDSCILRTFKGLGSIVPLTLVNVNSRVLQLAFRGLRRMTFNLEFAQLDVSRRVKVTEAERAFIIVTMQYARTQLASIRACNARSSIASAIFTARRCVRSTFHLAEIPLASSRDSILDESPAINDRARNDHVFSPIQSRNQFLSYDTCGNISDACRRLGEHLSLFTIDLKTTFSFAQICWRRLVSSPNRPSSALITSSTRWCPDRSRDWRVSSSMFREDEG